eukprot:COSAG04_NODE_13_length_42806_cov_92.030323_1_plen_57_part_10
MRRRLSGLHPTRAQGARTCAGRAGGREGGGGGDEKLRDVATPHRPGGCAPLGRPVLV